MSEPGKRVYEMSTLGLPPLRMVLVHARNDARNAAPRPAAPAPETPADEQEPLDKAQAVRRIIERLQELD